MMMATTFYYCQSEWNDCGESWLTTPINGLLSNFVNLNMWTCPHPNLAFDLGYPGDSPHECSWVFSWILSGMFHADTQDTLYKSSVIYIKCKCWEKFCLHECLWSTAFSFDWVQIKSTWLGVYGDCVLCVVIVCCVWWLCVLCGCLLITGVCWMGVWWLCMLCVFLCVWWLRVCVHGDFVFCVCVQWFCVCLVIVCVRWVIIDCVLDGCVVIVCVGLLCMRLWYSLRKLIVSSTEIVQR